MDHNGLAKEYLRVLRKVESIELNEVEDKFSGVFLPKAFEAYKSSNPKIMLVGRETAHWNTKNQLNTLSRITEKEKTDNLHEIIDNAFTRYDWHLKTGPNGKLKTKHRSHFKRYYQKLAAEFDIPSTGLIYANLLAWDYDGKSPLILSKDIYIQIANLSLELLLIQIKEFKPDYVIFATGVNKVDSIIKMLMEDDYFGGYTTSHLVSRKLWQFEAKNNINITFFRIAHPRAQNGHAQYREEVIEIIKSRLPSMSSEV